MPKQMKMMTDYQSYPLWWAEEGDTGNIDPATLPISSETLARLDNWARLYDATLNLDDPLASGFSNNQEENAFEHEGIDLWLCLCIELSPEYEVFYYSYVRHKLLRSPDDLL